MARYKVFVFVQHDDTRYGCQFSLKVDARTPDSAVGKAKGEAAVLCYEYHPEIKVTTPQVTSPPIEMKALKEAKA